MENLLESTAIPNDPISFDRYEKQLTKISQGLGLKDFAIETCNLEHKILEGNNEYVQQPLVSRKAIQAVHNSNILSQHKTS